MHLFEATWGMSSVLLMDMDGQEAFSSVSPHSEPAKAGSSVSQLSSGSSGPEELLPPPVCRLLAVNCAILLSLLPGPSASKGRISQHGMLLSTRTVAVLQFRLYTKKAPIGIGIVPK